MLQKWNKVPQDQTVRPQAERWQFGGGVWGEAELSSLRASTSQTSHRESAFLLYAALAGGDTLVVSFGPSFASKKIPSPLLLLLGIEPLDLMHTRQVL